MRLSRDEWAMELCAITAKRGTCCRRQVGCVLINHRGHVIATGYNGVAAGLPHCNERVLVDRAPEPGCFGKWTQRETFPNACEAAFAPSGTSLDGCEAIHAEQNALLQCKDVYEIHTAYVTASPCMTCTKLLLNTGCQRIVFSERYPHPAAMALWLESGRQLHCTKEDPQ